MRATRPDGYVDLRSYAAIGDGRTVALVALDGGIDWLPIPNLDSVPVFARILDAENGGSIQLAPVGDYTVKRRYVRDTNVLETTFTTAEGVAKVTDALVTGLAGRLPWVELARRIEGVRGEVRFRWRVTPGTAFGTALPWVDDGLHGKVLRVDGLALAVRGTDHGPRGGGDRDIRGTFRSAAGSRHLLVIAGTADEPLHIPVPVLTETGLERTIRNWREWSKDFGYDGPWAEHVQRSALALKLLIHAPTGAIAAAATTSLPENLAGGKNWDYRFAWVRDVAYTVHALTRFGLREETHAAVAWLLRSIEVDGSKADLSIFYTLEGGRPTEPIERDLPGWRGIGPVVQGNPAGGQRQHGIYGDLISVMLYYVQAGNVLDAKTARMLGAVADRVCDLWQQPDSGMWELPEERHYTASKMGCWQALESAIALHDLGQIDGSAAHWRIERDQVRDWIAENCWSASKQSYVAWPGTDELDASVLLHAPSGFDRGAKMSTTIDALRSELGRGALLFRYSGADSEEGAFLACSFWLAGALACVGRQAEAVELMDELVLLGNDVGILAEMIDPDDNSFLGNLPQGLSHLALITAAITIQEMS